jgi:hypothetical protein
MIVSGISNGVVPGASVKRYDGFTLGVQTFFGRDPNAFGKNQPMETPTFGNQKDKRGLHKEKVVKTRQSRGEKRHGQTVGLA